MYVHLLLFLSLLLPNVRTKTSPDALDDANHLLAKLTLEEKIAMITGGPKATTFTVERLGIRSLKMSDGPLGVKAQVEGEDRKKVSATAFPSAITMASTWNPELIHQIGEAIGEECVYNGVDVLLGPSVNIYRVPQNGRNFEYFGEDPYLASRLTVDYIKGLQSKGVLANVKHLAANNSEFNRYKSNSIVDKRTLHEIYLPVFEAAVKEAETATIMTAHNLLNGVHCSENSYLLDTVLRQQWGFKGFVISDWNSTYELIPAIKSGVDIEMPLPKVFTKEKIMAALQLGTITEKDIDDKVRRMLYTALKFNLYGKAKPKVLPNMDAHYEIALETAEQGTVLLKNEDNFLPLKRSTVKKIVIAGITANETPPYGGGAAGMDATRMQNMLEEMKQVAGRDIKISYIEKCTKENEGLVKEADLVLIASGFTPQIEGEAHDRPFDLPKEQVSLIQQLCTLNSKTTLAVYAGGGINLSPFINQVRSVVYAWYMGDATGHVIGKMLFGEINPSGKLPISIEKDWKDAAAFKTYDKYVSEVGMPALFKPNYERINGIVNPKSMIPTKYDEGVFIGYRHFNSKQITPLFPFGFGLSYTSFELKNSKVTNIGKEILIQLTVTNSGKMAGAEVIQLYVNDVKSSVPRPIKELKRFERVFLQPGESINLSFTLNEKDLSFWDVVTNAWKAEPGEFIAFLGNSSANEQLKLPFIWK